MRMGMLTGARVVLFDKWIPSKALETIAAEECTFCAGATTFLKDLLDLPEITEYDLPALRLFFLAGSPIPRPVVQQAYDQLENLTLMRVWGQTENGMVTATRLDDPIEKIATTDGRPLSHSEVTVREAYDGEEVRGEVGKLLMRGESLMEGYHRRPGITEESFTDDGWFKTGDLAVLHDDGYITIEGREKDIIIRGGENISAPEVEEHLLEHPDVVEVAVVAMPDDRLQERPCAYLRLVPDASPDDLTVESLSAFLDERGLQRHKHPERVEFVDAFSRTTTGKIQKFKLREDVADKLE
jgi:non-ribosomal peptide synthetase component E (peptide arylation enzyme)